MKTDTHPLTQEEQDTLTKFFDEGAAKVPVLDAYWINGADIGNDYCLKCARLELMRERARYSRLPKKDKKMSGLCISGGYRTEHDSPPICDRCNALLDGSLTEAGCSQELEHFIENGFDIASDDDRRAMSEVINGRGWNAGPNRVYERDYQRERDEEYFAALHALGRKIVDEITRVEAKP